MRASTDALSAKESRVVTTSTVRRPSAAYDRHLEEARGHACRLSRFHISIEAQTVQSSLLESGPLCLLHITRLLKGPLNGARNLPMSAANADILSPVDVRRANTSRTGSFSPALRHVVWLHY